MALKSLQFYLWDRSVNLPSWGELSAKAICCHIHSLFNSVYLDLEDQPSLMEKLGFMRSMINDHDQSPAHVSHEGWSAHHEIWSQVSCTDGEITLSPDITQPVSWPSCHTPHTSYGLSLFSLPDRLGNLPTPHTHVLRPQDCFTITIQTRFTDLLISKTLTIH